MPENITAADSLIGAMAEAALIGGAILLGLGLMATAATWLIVRRIRRSGIVRRSLDRGATRVRSFSTDGASRELAKLRLELQRSTQATRRSVASALAQGCPVGELPAAAEDLNRAELALTDQIRLAEREPNRALKQELAAAIGRQVHSLGDLSAELRRSLMDVHNAVGTAQVTRASARLSLESGALQSWSAAYGSQPRTGQP
ncbi:hypothetical protein [Arthrobacter sp. H5]|uniref:hypothetical protein n=1 Tax=Arthrobacter sp. H5 TaxID=1267973 RepID=UPI0004873CFD|nr:hypothetical protein [Arthrobacter sp. H5]